MPFVNNGVITTVTNVDEVMSRDVSNDPEVECKPDCPVADGTDALEVAVEGPETKVTRVEGAVRLTVCCAVSVG